MSTSDRFFVVRSVGTGGVEVAVRRRDRRCYLPRPGRIELSAAHHGGNHPGNQDALTAENTLHLLLSDIHARNQKPADQDKCAAPAAISVFSALSSENTDPAALITALARLAASIS